MRGLKTLIPVEHDPIRTGGAYDTVGSVLGDIRKELMRYYPLDYCYPSDTANKEEGVLWHEFRVGWRWVAAYAVRGDSEGWYFHLDLVGRGGYDLDKAELLHLMTAKTLEEDTETAMRIVACLVALTEDL